jgi:hypothetical protein
MKKTEKTLIKTKAEVTEFLKEFKFKLDFWGLIIEEDRKKNYETRNFLEISKEQIKQELRTLQETDFSEAKVEEFGVYGTEMWIFGKIVKGQEIYIKITLGYPNSQTFCISFHISDKSPMKYPFKTK